jgi:hypothetical protein
MYEYLLRHFQILAGLTALAQWAANDFRTWVERVVWKRLGLGVRQGFFILPYTFTVTRFKVILLHPSSGFCMS